jgi:hypothetical protein
MRIYEAAKRLRVKSVGLVQWVPLVFFTDYASFLTNQTNRTNKTNEKLHANLSALMALRFSFQPISRDAFFGV